jgi:hypothetical protein
MRSACCVANILFGLAFTLQGCWQGDRGPGPNSRVGTPAAEIVGEDLDGVVVRLSDYRGQIVVLDFWGDW